MTLLAALLLAYRILIVHFFSHSTIRYVLITQIFCSYNSIRCDQEKFPPFFKGRGSLCKRIIDGRAGMGQFQKETTGEHAYPATLSFHDGAPDCRMEGEERAVFEGDRISLFGRC